MSTVLPPSLSSSDPSPAASPGSHAGPDAVWRERMAAGASTLGERLGDGYAPVPGEDSEALAEARLARWRERVAGGDPQRFGRRLRWDGLASGDVRAVLGEVRLGDGEKSPPWTAVSAEWLHTLRHPLDGSALYPAGSATVPEEPLPFAELLLPALVVAWRRLEGAAGSALGVLSPSARGDLEGALSRRLGALCGRALYVELCAHRATRSAVGAYEAFVRRMREGGLEETFARLPVLARLAASAVERWVETTAELARRVEADAGLLSRAFAEGAPLGPVVEARTELSDPHRGGRTVAVLRFAAGARVVLKPRGMAMDAAWNGLLAWLGERAGLDLPAPAAVMDRGAYGWAAFVEPVPCAGAGEVERFGERAGMLLCLAYALGGGDLHAENVIARGADPVLVDLEVLLASPVPRVEPDEGLSASSLADRAVWESVLRTGLLPSWGAHGGAARRQGGLVAPGLAEGTREAWRNEGTGLMALVTEPAPAREAANLPRVDGQPRAASPEAVERGFARAHRALRKHRDALLAPDGPLRAFAAAEARLVPRDTRVYSALLRRSLHPRLLASGVERSIELDVLGRPLLRAAERPRAWALLRSERRDLEAGDVPVFTARADSVEVLDSAGEAVGALLDAPGLEEAARRLREMGDADLEVQSRLIRLAYAVAGDDAPPALPAPEGDLSPEAALEEAVAIAERLARTASAREDGSAAWIGLAPGARRFGWVDGRTLASGTPGIALFLAACGAVADRDDLRDLARRTLRIPLAASRRAGIVDEAGLGGATGVGGLVYALVRCARFLEDDEPLAAASRVAARITREHAARDARLDLHDGGAGAVLGLLALYAATGDADVLERARWFGVRLVSALAGDGDRATDALSTSGLAHGLSGIALALDRLHRVTGDGVFADAAGGARGRLGLLHLPSEGNWCERAGDGENPRCSWCHGAAGIVLAGAGGGDADEAALATVAGWPLGAVDHLCCGNLGRVETLLAASERLGRADLRGRASAIAGEVVRRARLRRGYGTGMPDACAPGFLQGMAGIGYALLRLHAPGCIPCALLWE